ncbi:MAG: leucine-rich repeat domain-containing protein, partial [Pseudomonadales bacterium]|nr:leucine-rich repeat domain-containing protein [Pseudomonadales bacterium]
SNNHLNNVMALQYTTQLQELKLSGNTLLNAQDVNNILSNNAGLEVLTISDVDFSGRYFTVPIKPGAYSSSLRVLEANNTHFVDADLNFIGQMPYIETLRFAGNNLQNVYGLDSRHKLQVIDISNNQIADIYPAIYLSGLKELRLSGNIQIQAGQTTQMVANNPELEVLGISDIDFSSFGIPVSLEGNAQSRLRILEANNTQTQDTDLSFLNQAFELQQLSFSGNALKSLNGIESAGNLNTLDVSNNLLSDVYAAQAFTQLQSLNLSGNDMLAFTEIDTLIRNNRSLAHLGLASIEIHDFPVYTLEPEFPGRVYDLKTLDLSYTQLDNVDLLNEYTQLLELKLEFNNFMMVDSLASLTQLSLLDLQRNSNLDCLSLENLVMQLGSTVTVLAPNKCMP